MRLTLRTLLSYLDDMLEPAQAKAIGAKVAESEQARDLMERIKQVTRKRRLTSPTTSGPGGIDPNTIAEYLDNEVTPEQAAEVEQICLASELHLAEVAACHQILTLVLGEPALVPPTAKQRMYTLVKGPESIPFRKPAKAASKEDQDLSSELEPDQDETLRLGVPRVGGGDSRNLLLLIGGGALAVCLLAFAVWQLVKPGPAPIVVVDNKDKDQNKDRDQNKDKEPVKDKDAGATKDKDKTTTVVQANDKDKNKDKDGDKYKDKDDKLPITIIPVPVKPEPPTVKYQPASAKQDAIASYVPPTGKDLAAVLLQTKGGGKEWARIKGKKDRVFAGRPLVSLPGSRAVLELDAGLEVTLAGNLPEVTQDHSALESRAILHVPVSQLDADLTIERGRILIANKKDKDLLIRVRSHNPTYVKSKDTPKSKDEDREADVDEVHFDVNLPAGAVVAVDRICIIDREDPFHEDPDDELRKGPVAIVKFFAVEKSAEVRFGTPWYPVSEYQQVEWQSRIGKVSSQKAELPPGIRGIPVLDAKDKKMKAAIEAQIKTLSAYDQFVKGLSTKGADKPIDVALAEAYDAVQKNAQKEMIGGKPVSFDTYAQWQHAVRCSAAVDSVADIYADLIRPETPPFIRTDMCASTLRQWMAWNRNQEYELLKVIQAAHNNKRTVSEKIMKLMHFITTEEALKPATFEYLIENLNNDVLPIRALSFWHLMNLAPRELNQLADRKIFYDPSMPIERRVIAVREWQKALPAGKLPQAPKAPTK